MFRLVSQPKDKTIPATPVFPARLGRYEIRSLLGKGGMGEVYLARDTELERTVAVKILNAELASNQLRMARFVQEAKTASALNHPNILTIYEIGGTDSTRFIATEFIDGVTLREHLAKSALKITDVLKIATQVASALAAAHSAGIVHRDIKPENIMVRSDGYIKVLDFGLAKLTERYAARRSADSEASTLVETGPGVVMGTSTYMSPEQARGTQVDERSDVFSLGVVLYEMVAGRRPFEGATASDVMAAILEREPVPLKVCVPTTPSELERIVRKALAKDVEERYQTIKDMAIDLRRLKRELDLGTEIERYAQSVSTGDQALPVGSGGTQAIAGNTQSAAKVSTADSVPTSSSIEYIVSEIKRHKKGAALAGVILVVALAAVGLGAYKLYTHSPTTVGAAFENVKVTRVTATGRARVAAISPDGKYVVYSEQDGQKQSLLVKQLATGSTVQIVPPAEVGYWGLTFSNDSNYVYYVRNERIKGSYNNLYYVPSLGGASKKLMEHVDSAITFSPDGQRFAFVRDNLKQEETLLVWANADGTGEQTLATRKAPDRFDSDLATRIAWSPDGKTIACAAGSIDKSGAYSNVVGLSVEDRSERPLTQQRWRSTKQVAWLPDGSGLLVVGGDGGSTSGSAQLWYLSYPSGETRHITNDLNRYRDVSVSAGLNSLVTVQTNQVSNIWIAPRDDTSRARQITSGTLDSNLSWTPDGRVVYSSTSSGKSAIWIMDADGSNQRQLTHEGESGRPRVSGDGRHVVFSSNRADRLNIWRMDIDSGNQKQLTDGNRNGNPYITPDGQWVVYASWDHGNGTIWKVSIDGGRPSQVSGPTANLPVVSPDGKQIACFYWDEHASPPRGVMIFLLEGGTPTQRFNIGPHAGSGFSLNWAPDGRALLYIANLSNVWSQPLHAASPVQLTD
ncbi:MAG TPA: protein kinase, partial [Pyrinomonadaceae bacterium]|nr:protein kinase [Pyrinomonadaceae bacterium]